MMRATTAALAMSLAMASACACACGGQYEAPTTTHAKPPAPGAGPLLSASASTSASSTAAAPITSPPLVEARVEKTSPARALATHLVVKRLVVAHSVKDHEPVFPDTTFKVADAGRIYAFVEVENDEKASGEVFVSFEPTDGAPATRRAPRGDVKLSVGTSPRWRTWAFTRAAKDVGSWVAVVRSANGEVLARAPFDVTL
jgi:hypothetical protein